MATIGGYNVVTNGLVLSLDAANARSYVSGSSTWFDVSGYANSGSLLNGPGYDPSYNGMITFDGVDDYFNSTNYAIQMGNTDFTMEFFLKINATTGNYGVMVWGTAPFNSFQKGVELRFRGSTKVEYTIADGSLLSGGSRLSYSGFTNLADGQFRHMVLTQVKQGLATFYVNAQSLATNDYSTITTYADTSNLMIGRGTDGYLNGNIPFFRIYNRSLSASEILQNYNIYKLRFGL